MLRGRASGNSKVLPTRSRSGWLPNIQVNWMNWLAVSCTPGRRTRCWPLPRVTGVRREDHGDPPVVAHHDLRLLLVAVGRQAARDDPALAHHPPGDERRHLRAGVHVDVDLVAVVDLDPFDLGAAVQLAAPVAGEQVADAGGLGPDEALGRRCRGRCRSRRRRIGDDDGGRLGGRRIDRRRGHRPRLRRGRRLRHAGRRRRFDPCRLRRRRGRRLDALAPPAAPAAAAAGAARPPPPMASAPRARASSRRRPRSAPASSPRRFRSRPCARRAGR